MLKNKIKKITTDFWNFCREVNIKLNIEKTFYVTSDNSDLEIEIDGHKLKQKNDLNILGVRFRSNLRQDAHIDYLNSCIPKFNHIVYNFRHFINTKNLKIILMSLVYGKINHTLSFQSEWPISKYFKLQAFVNNILNKALSRKILVEYKKKKIKDDQIISAIKRAKKRVDDLREKGRQFAKITLPDLD